MGYGFYQHCVNSFKGLNVTDVHSYAKVLHCRFNFYLFMYLLFSQSVPKALIIIHSLFCLFPSVIKFSNFVLHGIVEE